MEQNHAVSQQEGQERHESGKGLDTKTEIEEILSRTNNKSAFQVIKKILQNRGNQV